MSLKSIQLSNSTGPRAGGYDTSKSGFIDSTQVSPNGCLQQIAANRLTIPQNLAAILLQGFVLPASLALREGWNRLHSRFLATCVRAMTEPLSRAGKTP